MYEVCARKGKLAEAITPFLAPGVQAEYQGWHGHTKCERLWLKKSDGSYVEITADGDTNGYFHWKSEKS